ncbi:kinase-like domain-containing protein, partial [Mycena pura]
RGPLLASSVYAQVYLLYDDNNKCVFAEKRFHPEACFHPGRRNSQEVKNEITQTFLKLEHPNIVSFVAASVDVNYVHSNLDVVMEYVEGGTVEKMAKVLGPIGEGDARGICRQLAAGLEYLHYQSPPIIHKDIRGANLLITLDGCVKISDVGLPQPEIGTSLDGYAMNGSGNIPWMAPEIALGKHYTPGLDIWGMASTLIEMVEGGHPWADRLPLLQARPPISVLLSFVH